MKPQTKLVLLSRIVLLRELAKQQEETIRFYENKCVDAIHAQQQTLDAIEEIELEIEYEPVTE